MNEVIGDAVFVSFPAERFRFSVGRVDNVGYVRLQNQVSKQRWSCEVTDVGAFAPKGVMFPINTVLHCVAAGLKDSTGEGVGEGLNLVREGDKTLLLEVLVKLGVVDVAWAPKYIFPLKLVSEQTIEPSKQIMLLTAQVQELQHEVKTLKEQMKAVLLAQSAPQHTPTASLPSPGFTIRRRPRHSPAPVLPQSSTASENDDVSTPRKDRLWGDILTHTNHNHTLAKIEEYREIRNSAGTMVRRHRSHSCKVCSALRGEGRRTYLTCQYCVECTKHREGGMVFLCDKVRSHKAGEYQHATCNQIWHALWNHGEKMPETGVSSIRMRKKLKISEGKSTQADT